MAPKSNKDGAKAAAKAKVEKAKQVPPPPLPLWSGRDCAASWVAASQRKPWREQPLQPRVQAAADKTFGLKNKNKSKAVQQCVLAPRLLCCSCTLAVLLLHTGAIQPCKRCSTARLHSRIVPCHW